LLCWNRVAAVARNAVTALHPIRSIPPLAFWYIYVLELRYRCPTWSIPRCFVYFQKN
jgi:hypothetical protein